MGGQSHTVLVYIILLGQPVEHGPAAEDRESYIVSALEDHFQGELLTVVEAFLFAGAHVIAG